MKYLLDTHTFIWFDDDPEQLSPTVFEICQNRSNTLLLSLASVWEIQIKLQINKLSLRKTLKQIIEHQQQVNQLELLPVTLTHILELDNLPLHHKDPFDRLLIAQAKTEQIPLLSHDPAMRHYSDKVIW